MFKKSLWVATLAALAVVAGCASQKEPAEKAVASVEASLAEFKDDAVKFAKDQYDAVEAKIADLKARVEKKEYKEVVVAAPEVTKDVTALRETVAAKKTEFEAAAAAATEKWNALGAEVPTIVAALQKKVDALAKGRKDKTPSADSLMLDTVKNLWADASNLFSSGQAVEGAAKAEEAKSKAVELAEKLKVKI
jgi:dGTP triphosphohydrolase